MTERFAPPTVTIRRYPTSRICDNNPPQHFDVNPPKRRPRAEIRHWVTLPHRLRWAIAVQEIERRIVHRHATKSPNDSTTSVQRAGAMRIGCRDEALWAAALSGLRSKCRTG